MNKKITSKQPEMVTITEEHWKDFQQLVVNNANLEKENKELKQILTAHTTEDECQHKNMSNTNTHNKSGILQSAKICNDCNVVIPDPTEDEPIRIKDYDGYIFSIDKLPRKIANQIALRKWKEYEHWLGEWNGDDPAPQEHMTFDDWLQQEDK